MYMHKLVVLLLSGLGVANSMVTYKGNHNNHNRYFSHANNAYSPDGGELVQKSDRCGPVALRCYEPILSYMDPDGEFCGWKDMTTFWALPQICMNTEHFSTAEWGYNIVKNNYHFLKTCAEMKQFQQCVQNNQVCRRDSGMNLVMSQQNTFCNSIEAFLTDFTCRNAWDSSEKWYKLMYSDDIIVQACPAIHYRQLALNSIKLYLFSYITYPSSWTDRVVQSLNAEAAGRYICQSMQQNLCLAMRGDKLCFGYLPLYASQNYNYKQLLGSCTHRTLNDGKCSAFVSMNCPLNITSGRLVVKMDFSAIRNIYNLTYWHTVGNSEVDILLHTVNRGISYCDVSNLVFKQIGCFHKFMTLMDINHANEDNYLSKYMCSNMKIYNSCIEAYINSSCPDEANQFQGIGRFLHSQCDIFKVANKKVTCPLYAAYSGLMFHDESWFKLIVPLMQQYITLIKYTEIEPAPSWWRDVILNDADTYITYYKSEFIKGEMLNAAAYYENDIISIACDQEAADVYNNFATLSTGVQFYQLVNHVIKGFEYIKYSVQ